MGCCGSVPKPEEFLREKRTEFTHPPLLDGMPRAMLMNPWPLNLSFGSRSTNCTLSLTNPEGGLLASIAMPPRGSFGIGAAVTDAQGNPIAWLRSPHPDRQHGLFQSSYKIYAARAQVQGQQPVQVGSPVAAGYLWATVTRFPFTNKHTVTDSTEARLFTGRTYVMFDLDGMQTYTADLNRKGLCHISKRKTKDKGPMHDIRVAEGVDALLCVLVKLAFELATDELVQSNGGGGGGP